jgi:hypothetical protein
LTPQREEGPEARDGRTFRILQLTDFHNDVSDDLTARTYADVRRLVDVWRPDFLAVTGDIWCGDNKPELGPELMRRDLDFLGALGVPWAFAWGNHDYSESLAKDVAAVAAAPNACMHQGDSQGNVRVAVLHASKPAWDLYFLNSHGEGLWPRDLAWLEAEANRVYEARRARTPAIAFFHIPLQQYETARVNGGVQGIALEEVLFWGNSADRFDAIRRTGTIRACFAGHSHVNDYYFEEDGIVLAYGRATGHGGYGANRLAKGAKLIELDLASDRFTFRTVFPDGSAWTKDENGAPK